MSRLYARQALVLAVKMLTEKPYSQVTLADIARAVSVPESYLLRLFGGKDYLYAQAVRCSLYLKRGISFHPADGFTLVPPATSGQCTHSPAYFHP